jgi:hypothetical protein
LHGDLKALGRPCREAPPALNLGEFSRGGSAPQKHRPENIRARDRILNGQVDSNPTDRRHRMRGVTDA